MLSHHLAWPREGHLEQALHIFGYLKLHPKRKVAFDPDHCPIPGCQLQHHKVKIGNVIEIMLLLYGRSFLLECLGEHLQYFLN